MNLQKQRGATNAGFDPLLRAFGLSRRTQSNYRGTVTKSEARPVSATAHLCEDCPPVGYPTDKTRCEPCPRRAPAHGDKQP